MLQYSVVFCDRPFLKIIPESLLCNTRIVQLDAGFGWIFWGNKLRKFFDGQPRFVSFFSITDGSFLAVFYSLLETGGGIFLNLFLQIGHGLKVEERLRPQEAMVLHSRLGFPKFNPVSSVQARLHTLRSSSPGWLNLFSAALDSNLRRLMRMLIVGVWTQSGNAWI